MSDYTTQGGTDWELKEAENALIAAGDDPQARALAQRRHAEAIRNMMQSALVPSFEKAVSTLIDKSAAAVIAEVHVSIEHMTSIVQQILTATQENARGLKKQAKEIKELQVASAAHATRLDDQDERYGALLHGALARIERLEVDRARFEVLEARIGGALPTEANQDLSARLRVDEEARRGDGRE